MTPLDFSPKERLFENIYFNEEKKPTKNRSTIENDNKETISINSVNASIINEKEYKQCEKYKINEFERLFSKPIFKFKDYMKTYARINEKICSICNNGDYQEDNVFIFCLKCKMAVHVNCYGAHNKKADEFICELCSTFDLETVYNVECILCPVKGGSMKKTNVKIGSEYLRKLNKLRKENNNSYESFYVGLLNYFKKRKKKKKKDTNFVQVRNNIDKLKIEHEKHLISIDINHLNDELVINRSQANVSRKENATKYNLIQSSILSKDFYDCNTLLNDNVANNFIHEISNDETILPFSENNINENNIYNSNTLHKTRNKIYKYKLTNNDEFATKNEKKKKKKEENLNTINMKYAWVHLSCVLWNSSIHVDNFNKKEEFQSKILNNQL